MPAVIQPQAEISADRIPAAANELAALEVLVEDSIVAFGLASVAVDRVGQFFRGGSLEVHGLAGERPESGSHEKKPRQQLSAVGGRTHQLACLLAEIEQGRR